MGLTRKTRFDADSAATLFSSVESVSIPIALLETTDPFVAASSAAVREFAADRSPPESG